jgi:hypothetical protein
MSATMKTSSRIPGRPGMTTTSAEGQSEESAHRAGAAVARRPRLVRAAGGLLDVEMMGGAMPCFGG